LASAPSSLQGPLEAAFEPYALTVTSGEVISPSISFRLLDLYQQVSFPEFVVLVLP
jgi:hypothetical protein